MANWTTGLYSEEIASHYGFNVAIDVKEVEKALSGTRKSLPSIQRKTLSTIARGAIKQIKAVIKSGTHRRTGELLKAYRYKIKKDGTATIYPKAVNNDARIFPKASVQSFGHNGATKRAKNFPIKAVGFIQAGNQYIESGAYVPEINKMIDKELTKYWS